MAESLSLPLVPLPGLAELPADAILREGGSRPAVMLLAGDMSSYYCKSPFLMPEHPYLGVNEWIFAQLARLIGLPVRTTEIISWKGQLYVGGMLLPNDRHLTGPLTDVTWAKLRNALEVAYLLVVLDAWTLNSDRHGGNWLGGVVSSDQGWFLANDHDMALLPPQSPPQPQRRPEDLMAYLRQPVERFIVLDVIKKAVTDRHQLEAALVATERVNDETLRYNADQLPDEWINAKGKANLVAFLGARRDLLRELFHDATWIFPDFVGVMAA